MFERPLVYAGIGSRKADPRIQWATICLSRWLSQQGWWLRTGGAAGMDEWFARGAETRDPDEPPRRMVYLPWNGFRGWMNPAHCYTPEGEEMDALTGVAAALHPNWGAVKAEHRPLHARNAAILLGRNLRSPVEAVICWTPGGEVQGGTGMGIRIAQAYGIPVHNLAVESFDTVRFRMAEHGMARRGYGVRAGPGVSV